MEQWAGDKVERRSVDELIPYARNSRTHSAEQVSQIAASIQEWGFTNPVLIDEGGNIIAGHGRILAAQKLKINSVPTIKAIGWTEAQKKAYIIADNKLSLNAGWDIDLLKIELDDLSELNFDLGLTGFNADEIAQITATGVAEGLTDEDDAPDLPENPTSVAGDVWLCGQHRVMCGDSTDIESIEKLLNGNKVDILFTDPPYNVSFNGRSGRHDVIENDNLSEEAFSNFIDEMISAVKIVQPKAYYIWCNWKFYSILQEKMSYKACIVWAKNVFGMGVGYRHQHEFCLFNGEVDPWIKNESDLWSVKKDHNYVHPTQKPVELSVRAFSNHSRLLNILDLFGGSGSTLIGAEQTGRKAHIMELDPKYVDVAVQRWQSFKGESAILEQNGKSYDELHNERSA